MVVDELKEEKGRRGRREKKLEKEKGQCIYIYYFWRER